MADSEHEHAEEDADYPSKSARKRESNALQEIGIRLTNLTEAQLARIPIADDALLEAIRLARSITARGGLRRQHQYIGKLMRRIDPTPIVDALSRMDGQHQEENARFHRLEALRDSLLEQGDQGLAEVIARFPQADRQRLRQFVRQHSADQQRGAPPTAARKLFRYLRELDEAASGSGDGDSSPGDGTAGSDDFG